MGSASYVPRRLRALTLTVVLSVIGTVTANVGETASAAAPEVFVSLDTSAYQRNVQSYVNAHRRAHGLVQLSLNAALTKAAQGHANDMARMNRMTHIGSNGSNGGTRIRAAGFSWSLWGENVAVGYGSSSAVVYAWMQSAGHRANILNSGFRYMGLGITFARGTVWWCLVFAR